MSALNYNHLRYFWAVAHEGNLTRTAARLNLSQSVAYSNDLTHLVRHEYTHAVIHDITEGAAPI